MEAGRSREGNHIWPHPKILKSTPRLDNRGSPRLIADPPHSNQLAEIRRLARSMRRRVDVLPLFQLRKAKAVGDQPPPVVHQVIHRLVQHRLDTPTLLISEIEADDGMARKLDS